MSTAMPSHDIETTAALDAKRWSAFNVSLALFTIGHAALLGLALVLTQAQ